MTFERKIIVGLDDIRAIIFECEECHSRISMNPDNVPSRLPQKCAECGRDWIHDANRLATIKTPSETFVDMLARLRTANAQRVGFHIRLEFEEPSE
jgi:hypothetical protein